MKNRLWCVLAVLILMVSISTSGLSEKSAIALKRFDERYNNSLKYLTGLFNVAYTYQAPQIAKTEGHEDLFTFTYQSSHILIQGNAYSDTGIISSIVFKLKTNTNEAMLEAVKVVAFFYGVDSFDGSYEEYQKSGSEKLTKAIENAKKKKNGVPYEGFTLTYADMAGVGGWAGAMGLAWDATNPRAETYPDAMSYDDYVSYFADKTIDAINELTEKAKAALEQLGGAVPLASGEYIAGKHIPAGEYSVTTTADAVHLTTRREGELRINEVLSPSNSIGRVVLKGGDEIEISGGSVIFTPLK